MNRLLRILLWIGVAASLCSASLKAGSAYSLDDLQSMQLLNTRAEKVTYRGRPAVQLLPPKGQENSDESMLAIVPGPDFKNGTIEVELAGAPRAGVPPNMRGFIGIAFRVQANADHFECFYLRPANGRADDQLQRNHSLQYVSEPDFGWQRLRQENPGVYESYSDLETGAWTKVKIVVAGAKAQLYVNGADQPSLIVNDLKLGDSHGQIALWSHTTTEGYFSNLSVKPAP